MKEDLEFITFEVDELKALLVLCMSDAAARINLMILKSNGDPIALNSFEKMFNRDVDQMILNKKRRDYAGLD